jgi:protease PrsW
MFRKEFDSILDGIVYGAITAMGFAAIETSCTSTATAIQENGWEGFWVLVVIRVILVGWMHPFFTAFTGIGLAVARMSRNVLVKIIAVPTGYAIAVTAHAFHNTFSGLIGGIGGLLAGTFVDYIGYAAMFAFVIWMIVTERNILKKNLRDEVSNGLISSKQYNSAISFFQISPLVSGLTSGSFLATSRFYQVCGELAHKKEQLVKMGDEGGNQKIIENLRAELVQLAPRARA